MAEWLTDAFRSGYKPDPVLEPKAPPQPPQPPCPPRLEDDKAFVLWLAEVGRTGLGRQQRDVGCGAEIQVPEGDWVPWRELMAQYPFESLQTIPDGHFCQNIAPSGQGRETAKKMVLAALAEAKERRSREAARAAAAQVEPLIDPKTGKKKLPLYQKYEEMRKEMGLMPESEGNQPDGEPLPPE